jgi:hypothetical protein
MCSGLTPGHDRLPSFLLPGVTDDGKARLLPACGGGAEGAGCQETACLLPVRL